MIRGSSVKADAPRSALVEVLVERFIDAHLKFAKGTAISEVNRYHNVIVVRATPRRQMPGLAPQHASDTKRFEREQRRVERR